MSDIVHLVAVAFQLGIVVAGVAATRRGDVAAAVNAGFALAVTLVPVALRSVAPSAVARAVHATPGLSLWLGVAGFLHVVGMLGWYETVWWWDHLTHTLSAALLGALVYASVIVVARIPAGPTLSPAETVAATVAIVFALGLFWELIELFARDVAERFDIDPVLVYYGRLDTVLDLAFDVVGVSIVVIADLRVFVDIAAVSPSATLAALRWIGTTVVVGTVVVTLALLVGRLLGAGDPTGD